MTELQIKYFFKVCETSSFSKTARELYVSQPTVSWQIASLEEELGFLLFDRTHKSSIVLTPAGRIFFDGLQESQNVLGTALEKAKITSSIQSYSSRIGLVEGWRPFELMKRTIDRCEESFPNSQVTFHTDSFENLRKKLKDQKLDAILTVQTSLFPEDNLFVRHITDVNATLFFSEKHTFSDPEWPQLSDFRGDYCYVLPDEETPLSRNINRGFFIEKDINPVFVEKPNRDSMFLSLCSGKGFAVFDSLTGLQAGCQTLKLDNLISICLAERNHSTTNPITEIFAEEVQKL